MKKNMSAMTGAAFGLSFEAAVAEGGGAGASTSTGGGAGASGGSDAGGSGSSAGTSGASGSSTGSDGKAGAPASSGFFRGLPTSTVQKKETVKTGTTETDTAKTGTTDATGKAGETGKKDATTTSAAGSEAGKEAAGKGNDNPEALSRPLMGRYTTLTEAEVAMRRSQDEGIRLSTENKTLRESHQKEIANRDTELAALKAELKLAQETPAFKELNKEEFAALAKEDPASAIEYAAQKRDRDQTAKAAKEQAERTTRERQERMLKVNKEIENRDFEMRKDAKNFPKFEELNPVMDQILKVTMGDGDSTPLRGQSWANELLYLAAMGHTYKQLLAAGTEVTDDAAKAAKAKSEADAAASRTGKGDGGGSSSTTPPDADQAWRDAVRKSAPKPFFRK